MQQLLHPKYPTYNMKKYFYDRIQMFIQIFQNNISILVKTSTHNLNSFHAFKKLEFLVYTDIKGKLIH